MEPVDYEAAHVGRGIGAATYVTFAAIAWCLVLLAGVALLVAHYYPSNHWGADTLSLLWGLMPPATWLIVCGPQQQVAPRWRVVLLAAVIAAATSIWAVDHYNLLVGYEKWIKRGMP